MTGENDKEKMADIIAKEHPLLAKAAEDNFEFPADSSLGRSFKRFIQDNWSEDEQFKFWGLSQNQKKAWRAKWAKDEYDHIYHSRENTESYATTDLSEYEDLNWDQLVVAEGGWRESVIKGCMVIAQGCIAKGPPFVGISDQSGRITFKHKRTKVNEARKNEWLKRARENNDDWSQVRRGMSANETPVKLFMPRASAGARSQAPADKPAEAPEDSQRKQSEEPEEPADSQRVQSTGKDKGKGKNKKSDGKGKDKKGKGKGKDKKGKGNGKDKKKGKDRSRSSNGGAPKVINAKTQAKQVQDVVTTYSMVTQRHR